MFRNGVRIRGKRESIYWRNWLSWVSLLALLTACSLQQSEENKPEQAGESYQNQQNQAIEGKTSKDRKENKEEKEAKEEKKAAQENVQLKTAQVANQLALQIKGVEHVASVALAKELSLAVQVSQLQRWHLEAIRKQIFHDLRVEFPELEIHVSTDRKIFWELQELEKEMYATPPDLAKIQRKLQKINEDMKG